MADRRSRDAYADRLKGPLSRGDWVVLMGVDALGLAGLITGVLGPEWYLLTPWTAAVAYCAYNAVAARRDVRTRRTPLPG